MKKFTRIVLCLIVVSLLTTSFTVNAATGEGAYIKAAFDMITQMYEGDIDNQTIYENIIKNMFNSLDEYSEYYDLEQAEVLFNRLENTVEGIGVMLTDISGNITVVELLEGSPAEDAGIMAGDIIVQADDTDLRGMTSSQASAYIKGEKDTTVRIGVVRGKNDKVLFYDVQRKNIVINPVSYEIMENDIAYIKITSFSFDADVYFNKVMGEVNQKGVKKVVLDLRNNGGGSVQAAVNVAAHFVPEGIITTLDFESPDVNDQSYTTTLKENPYDLVVLVNELTASASELFAAAVRDTYCGVVVGEKTYGKSVFQQILPIVNYEAFEICYDATEVPLINYYDLLNRGIFVPDSYIMGYVKLTVGEYLTPIGRKINKIGVKPMKYILNKEVVNDVYIEGLTELFCLNDYNVGDSGAEIYRSKHILKALGYDLSIETDKMEEDLFQAVKSFQADHDLNVTGELNIDTQKVINVELVALQKESDKQLQKAVEILK